MRKKLSIPVDLEIYPLQAVQAAAYTFTDRSYVRLAKKSGVRAVVEILPKKGSEYNRTELEGEFMNELLHHALRLKIAGSNRKIREYITARALLSCQPAGRHRRKS